MKLSKEEVKELNKLLESKYLDLPSFRRSVRGSGGNFRWLQRNIRVRNPELPIRLVELLGLRTEPTKGDLENGKQKTKE